MPTEKWGLADEENHSIWTCTSHRKKGDVIANPDGKKEYFLRIQIENDKAFILNEKVDGIETQASEESRRFSSGAITTYAMLKKHEYLDFSATSRKNFTTCFTKERGNVSSPESSPIAEATSSQGDVVEDAEVDSGESGSDEDSQDSNSELVSNGVSQHGSDVTSGPSLVLKIEVTCENRTVEFEVSGVKVKHVAKKRKSIEAIIL